MFGDFLRELRLSRGMTQAEMAAIACVPAPNISAYESNRRQPSGEVLLRLLAACGYNLAAVTHNRTILGPAAVFPGEETLPSRLPDDPPPEPPTFRADTPVSVRDRALQDLLELAETVMASKSRRARR